MSGSTDSERIAELEREVARLREQVAQRDAAQEQAFFQGPAPTPPEPTESAEDVEDAALPAADAADQDELHQHMPSRRRAIVIGVVVGAVALAAIIAIVLSLSQVITPLSRSAAGALEPFEGPSRGSGQQALPPAKASPSPLRAPGL